MLSVCARIVVERVEQISAFERCELHGLEAFSAMAYCKFSSTRSFTSLSLLTWISFVWSTIYYSLLCYQTDIVYQSSISELTLKAEPCDKGEGLSGYQRKGQSPLGAGPLWRMFTAVLSHKCTYCVRPPALLWCGWRDTTTNGELLIGCGTRAWPLVRYGISCFRRSPSLCRAKLPHHKPRVPASYYVG